MGNVPQGGQRNLKANPNLSLSVVQSSLTQTAQQYGLTYDPNQTFTGAKFGYDTTAAPPTDPNQPYAISDYSDLWGDVGYGPLGPQFDQAGISTQNVYVPGYFSSQKPVLGHPPVMTLDFFKRTYMRGLERFTSQMADMDAQFSYFLDTAVGAMEAKMGMFLYPRTIACDATERGFRPGVDFDIEEREIDFIASDWFNWGWMSLRYGPVMQITNMNLVYPTGAEILKIPMSWVKPQMLSRQLRLVPPQGALSQVVVGPGGFLTMLIGGMMMDMPALIFVGMSSIL